MGKPNTIDQEMLIPTHLDAHQSKMAYEEFLKSEHAEMIISGERPVDASKNEIPPEMLANQTRAAFPALDKYMVDLEKGPQPSNNNAKKDPAAIEEKKHGWGPYNDLRKDAADTPTQPEAKMSGPKGATRNVKSYADMYKKRCAAKAASSSPVPA